MSVAQNAGGVWGVTLIPAAFQVWLPHQEKLELFEHEADAESFAARNGGVVTPLFAIER